MVARRPSRLLLTLAACAAALGCEGLLPIESERAPAPAPGDPGPGQDQPGTGQGETGRAEPAASADEHPLEGRWRPLVKVVERPSLPGLSERATTTVGDTVYVADLERWLAEHPPGDPRYDAVLLHEQVHARRQGEQGLEGWLDRYLNDRAFMWSEEQLGWYEQIQELKRRGLGIDAAALARNLAGYGNLAGPMVSEQEARAWVDAVLAGQWRPGS